LYKITAQNIARVHSKLRVKNNEVIGIDNNGACAAFLWKITDG